MSGTISSYKTLEDKDLVALAKKGDQVAFRVIYERYEKAVRQHVSKFFQWKADVDDVCVISFQKFFTKIDAFDTGRDLLPWLYTIAYNTALDHLGGLKREDTKKENIKKKRLEESEDGPDIVTDDNPEDEIINRLEHERLMNYIDQLDEKYRVVIEKYMKDDMEYDEISKQLGLPLNTVKTRIHRGKALLAEMMARGEHI